MGKPGLVGGGGYSTRVSARAPPAPARTPTGGEAIYGSVLVAFRISFRARKSAVALFTLTQLLCFMK